MAVYDWLVTLLAEASYRALRRWGSELPGWNGQPSAASERDDVRSGLLTAEEVSKLLAIPPRRVYEMAKQGELPSVRIGRLIRFPRQAVADWVASQQRGMTRQRPVFG